MLLNRPQGQKLVIGYLLLVIAHHSPITIHQYHWLASNLKIIKDYENQVSLKGGRKKVENI